jgi:hypothetical protein
MKIRIAFLLTLLLVGVKCGESKLPRSQLDFSKMEIHHIKALPRGQTIGVAVYPDGSAHAFVFAGVALRDTLSQSSRVLSLQERASLSKLFEPFPFFEAEYNDTTISDGGYWITRLTYKGSTREVTVLDKAKHVPAEVREMLNGMDALWQSIMGDEAGP